jgi:prepilin peptidase CpaA
VMDFFTMTIPNKISLALVAGFLVIALLAGVSWQVFLDHVGAGLLVLVISIFMFSRGWFGGGDAKLLSAAALWFGFDQHFDYTVLVTILGGLLALFVIAYREGVPPMWISGMGWAERLYDRSAGIPYGLALAGAGLWLFPSSQIFLMHVAT